MGDAGEQLRSALDAFASKNSAGFGVSSVERLSEVVRATSPLALTKTQQMIFVYAYPLRRWRNEILKKILNCKEKTELLRDIKFKEVFRKLNARSHGCALVSRRSFQSV